MSAQTFTSFDLPIPVAAGGMAQWADYDGDGDYDFVITGQPELRVYRNDGNSAFVPQGLVLTLRQSGAAVWGDWDNDNDLDLIVGGADTGGAPVQNVYSLTRLYRNDGSGGFVLASEGIPFIGHPTLQDMDRDGDLDLVIAGDVPNIGAGDSLTIRAIRVYSNEGNGKFELRVELPTPHNTVAVRTTDLDANGWADLLHLQLIDGGIRLNHRLNSGSYQFSSNSWEVIPIGPGLPLHGDIDNDDDEDLGIFSYDNGPYPNYPGWLRNDGDTNTPLPGISFPLFNLVCSLADYDNDGRLDVAVAGGSTALGNVFRLFHNEGDFAFSQVNPGIEGIQFAVMAWGDSDQDGDLDLLLSGIPNPPSPGSPFIRLYRNNASATNFAPQTPSGLSAAVAGSGVVLNWAGATDANQAGGLSYNLRVGRAPGGAEVVTPAANASTGRLLLPQPGNASYGHFAHLTNLLAGTCYWSVQTVDHAFAGSPFATEGSFVIPPGLPRPGAGTAADVRYQHATLVGSAIPNGAATLVWFEYGLSTNYNLTMVATPIGDSIVPVPFTNEITGLLTATQYHFRVVASNSVGLAAGSDAVFFISNTAPAISGLTNFVSIPPNQSSSLLTFQIGDLESPPDSLQVTGTVFNATLLPPAGIEFGGSGSNRTLRLTPAADQRGRTTLTVRVLDEHGGQRAQNLTVSVEDFAPVWSPLTGSDDIAVGDVNRDGFLDVIRNGRWLRNLSGTNLSLAPDGLIQNPISGILALGDFDNDGDLDIVESGNRLTSLWTNEPPPAGSFLRFRTAGVTNLQGYSIAAISLADFDQDGDTDLLLAGHTNVPSSINNYATRTYRNDGSLRFNLVPGLFPNLSGAAFGWADFDRDGDLDVCVTGTTNLQLSGSFTGLFSNDGAGQFTRIPTSLPAITGGFVAWGDFDNDDWPDLLLCGVNRTGNVSTNIARLFRNFGDGTFTDYATFEGLVTPRVLLTDIDNDGRLDVLYVGSRPILGLPPIARFYLNQGGGSFLDIGPDLASGFSPANIRSGDLDRDGTTELILGVRVYRNNFTATNTRPTAPTNLNAVALADTVHFSWAEPTDPNQAGGLTYNLRVGTAPGQGSVMSALADTTTGHRWIPAAGNASQSLQWRLRNLPPGNYYWSVQAVDHTGAGSPFALEQSFNIADASPRFLSVERVDDTLILTVELGVPGNYSMLVSSNLHSWQALPPVDYPAGKTNLAFAITDESNRFFRLRKN